MQLAPQPSKSVFRLSEGCRADEPVFFWRPFSNLPARHVLDSLTDGDTRARSKQAQALFLGCTDPRTIIKSLAVLQLDRGRQQLQLAAVLNDVHVPILARTALLLLMAAELDPTSKADMRLLFDVWFNTIWHADTWPRFAAFTQRLIDGSMPWLMPARRQDQQQLQEVWCWWLDEKHPNRPTPAKIRKARSTFNTSNPVQAHSLYKQPRHLFDVGSDKYPAGFRNAVKVLHPTAVDSMFNDLTDARTMRMNYESTATKPAHVEQARLALCAVLDGVTQHLETGSLSWDGNRREAHGNTYSSNMNITFVEPGTGAWNVHPDQQPFTCWGTYTAEELTTAMQTGLRSGTALADVFITSMASFVQCFQRNTTFHARNNTSSHAGKPVALQVQLICGEALGLCLHDPFSQLAASATASPASNDNSRDVRDGRPALPPLATFDIIDTGSLCDDVGLLPLLVAVTPRLSNHPAARLHTVPATWTLAAPRVDYYLQEQALGMPLSMTPTLLGLRLVTNTTCGRPSAYRNLIVEAAAFDPRELAWAPVPPSQPRPRLLLPDLTTSGTDQYAYKDVQWGPPGSIGAVLQNLCKLCCTNNHHTALPHKYADVAVNLSTPQTFAWLLASCIPRLDMSSLVADQQHSDSSSHQGDRQHESAAAAHRALWALCTRVSVLLPAHFRMAFRGAIDAVRASLQATTGSAAAEAAGAPACNHQSFLMLPITELEHGGLAVAAGVRLRRPFLRALLGAQPEMAQYTLQIGRITRKNAERLGPGDLSTMFKFAGTHADHVYEFAYEGSPLDPAPRQWAVISKVQGVQPSNIGLLKAHVLDCCGVPYSKGSGWRAAFMIPSDHASMQLPDVTSMLVSVGPDYFGSTSPQKHKFMDIPIQAVSPVLAQCFLHPLLCSHATSTAALHQPSSPALQVTHIDETVWDYKVVLKLQGPGTPSGLSIALPQAATAKPPPRGVPACLLCPSSHIVEVSLREPAGVSTQLVLGWPVAAGLGEPEGVVDNAYSSGCGVTAKLKKSEGVVQLTLAKAQVWERWPEDGVPPLQRCKVLAQHLAQSVMSYTLQFMYAAVGSIPDSVLQRQSAAILDERSAKNALRDFFTQAMGCLVTGRPFTAFLFHETSNRAPNLGNADLHMLMSGDYSVDEDDGQRLVIPSLVVDLKLLTAMCAQQHSGFDGGKYQHAVKQRVIGMCQVLTRGVLTTSSCGPILATNGPGVNIVDGGGISRMTPVAVQSHELVVMRRYLWRNAQRWQPRMWQQALLDALQAPVGPAGPYVMPCYATYLTPLFVEHGQQFNYSDKVFNELFPAGITPPGEPLPYLLAAPAVAANQQAAQVALKVLNSGITSAAGTPTAATPSAVVGVHPTVGGKAASSTACGNAAAAAVAGMSHDSHPGPNPTMGSDVASAGVSSADNRGTEGSGAKSSGCSTAVTKRGKKGMKGAKGKKNKAAASANTTGIEAAHDDNGKSGDDSDDNQSGMTSVDHESWVCGKMSELRADFSHCTDEELRSMAEMAFNMHAQFSGT